MLLAKKIFLSSCALINFVALVSQSSFAMDSHHDESLLVSRKSSRASSSKADDENFLVASVTVPSEDEEGQPIPTADERAQILINLGDSHRREEELNAAISYYKQALGVKDNIILYELKCAYKAASDPMITFCRQALNLRDTEGNNICIGVARARVLSSLGDAYFAYDLHDAAISAFTEALNMKDDQGYDVLIGAERAQLFKKLGDIYVGEDTLYHNTAMHYYYEAVLLPGNNENEFALPDEQRTEIWNKINKLIFWSMKIDQLSHRAMLRRNAP
ncbi:tetratricopeptide repeat protein [Geitlerinema splendidum]|nr:tetratricopeptide repeat protein [Geitlerinema splendidum]